ncbi:hypothetical protein EZV73_27305 [Acidaminobacter sp. JC074]|nr:hypothetical protein [Acidaminobacter sp. JC074]
MTSKPPSTIEWE